MKNVIRRFIEAYPRESTFCMALLKQMGSESDILC